MLQHSNSNRGGVRSGAGRPKGKETVVVRIDKDLLPIVELLKISSLQRLENAVLALHGKDGFTALMEFIEPYRD